VTWRPSKPPRSEQPPQSLRPSLDRIAARLGLAPPAVLGPVFARWEELVGADIAAHARPRSLRDGVLVVVADHPAWATSLRLLAGDLLARVREATGDDAVRELVVRVGEPGPGGREPRL